MAAGKVPQSLFAAELSDATVVAHETVNEDKRFTVYKLEISSARGKFVVFRRYYALGEFFSNLRFRVFLLTAHHLIIIVLGHYRYSEFRELYALMTKAFSQETFKFPPKKIIGNFGQEFLQVCLLALGFPSLLYLLPPWTMLRARTQPTECLAAQIR